MAENTYLPHPAPILDIRQETAVDWTFRLRWNGDSPRPGQFLQLSVPRAGEAPISASGWGYGWVELTVRRVGTVTGALFALPVGSTVHLRGPYGNPFPVEEFAGWPTVVAAGGTGLAPVRGLIRHLLGTKGTVAGPSEATILAGFRSPADVLFAADLAAWGATVTVDRGGPGWQGHVGVITTLVPDLPMPDPAAVRAVVVGPPLMMKYTVASFLDRGLAPEQIWVSYERRMSCGLGKCGHCKIMHSYVCVDGPVYRYADAQYLID